MLVKRKYLRKAYTDPMTKHGKWRFIFPGDPGLMRPGAGPGTRPGMGGMAGPEGRPGSQPTRMGSGGETIGPFMGVASTSTDESLRLFNGRSQYDQWIFAVGMPQIIGKPPVLLPERKASPAPGPEPVPPSRGSASRAEQERLGSRRDRG